MRLAVAAIAAVLLLAAPAGAQTVATVDGAGEVTRSQFDHWLRIARKATPGQRVKGQVMRFLIESLWVRGEADERGVAVPEEDVRQVFRERRRREFPSRRAFARFRRSTGQTVGDLLDRIRTELLSAAVREDVERGVPPASEEEVRAKFDEDPRRWAVPERRDVRFTFGSTRRDARSGPTKNALYVKRGEFPRAVFRRRRGLARWEDGWIAFRVVRVHPRRARSFEEAEEDVRESVEAERRDEAMTAFLEDFRVRWRERTLCAARYEVRDCGRITP